MVHEIWLGANLKLSNSRIFNIVTVKLHGLLEAGDSG